jgi:hypothetical protein
MAAILEVMPWRPAEVHQKRWVFPVSTNMRDHRSSRRCTRRHSPASIAALLAIDSRMLNAR